MTKILLPLLRVSASHGRLKEEVLNLEQQLQFLSQQTVSADTLENALQEWANHHYAKYVNVENVECSFHFFDTVLKIHIEYKLVWNEQKFPFVITIDSSMASDEPVKEKEAVKITDIILAADEVHANYGNGVRVVLSFNAENPFGMKSISEINTFRYHFKDK